MAFSSQQLATFNSPNRTARKVEILFSKHVAWNEVESGYTERNMKPSIDLTEPQGKFKK